jgi:hypothetical protein
MAALKNVQVLALDSVRQPVIDGALQATGTGWDEAAHVTATVSLAKGIYTHRSRQAPAVPIATLLDLIGAPALAGDYAYPIDSYPTPSDLNQSGPKAYHDAAASWVMGMRGRRIRMALAADQQIRNWAMGVHGPSQKPARVLMRSSRPLLIALEALVAAGAKPSGITVGDPLAQQAVEAWKALEKAQPSFAWPREDFWIDPRDFSTGKTAHAIDLRGRVEAVLRHVFGRAPGIRTIVHHGFYFYTPIQWSLFSLLAEMQEIRQVFIVHDDGVNPAFQIWRQFFSEKWQMPRPTYVAPSEPAESGVAAKALHAALLGERVDAVALGEVLEVVEYRSPSEFVRALRADESDEEQRPSLYAADKDTVNRYVARLSDRASDPRVDLAQLPVGAFLMGLFSCFSLGLGGETRVTLTAERLCDIAASGYLPLPGGRRSPPSVLSLLRRVVPFFRGCTRPDQWQVRAAHLEKLIVAEVAPMGARVPTDDDLQRLRSAAGNPLRSVPWADITAKEARLLCEIVDSTAETLAQLSSMHDQTLGGRLAFIRKQLESGMAALPADLQSEVKSKLDGFSVDVDGAVDVHCLASAVSLLLGRAVTTEPGRQDDDDLEGAVRNLRSLDELGLTRSARSLHLANLADGKFPSVVPSLPWPFAGGRITKGLPVISDELLAARSEYAPLSDLYLLWLAMDGIEAGQMIRLSWISDVAGEAVNPSAVFGLFVSPDTDRDAIQRRAGGLKVVRGPAAEQRLGDKPLPMTEAPTASEAQVASALDSIDGRTLGISEVCPRRFAIQWAMGPSGSFQQDHHHSMLFGNAVGALAMLKSVPEAGVMQACLDLWRNLAEGERVSSLEHRRVKVGGTKPAWIHTLAGGANRKEHNDLAYQVALGTRKAAPKKVAIAESVPLPVVGTGNHMGEACLNCAVRPRCAVWVDKNEIF